MTRAEHLQWCKNRALAYCKTGDLEQAFASFTSDMNKHKATALHEALPLGRELFFGGHLNTVRTMAHWIKGFG